MAEASADSGKWQAISNLLDAIGADPCLATIFGITVAFLLFSRYVIGQARGLSETHARQFVQMLVPASSQQSTATRGGSSDGTS